METKPTLSYLVATKNKLPYLKKTLDKLTERRTSDEEILVADGVSKDGTADFLAELKTAGKIDRFASEADSGVPHALNKLILASRGQLFMMIADDDAYHYPSIEACKKFMLDNPSIDAIASNGGVLYPAGSLTEKDPGYTIRALDYVPQYLRWQESRKPFSFAELGLILRRSSLPIVGLRDPSVVHADAEFSFRLTAGRANLAWYSGYSFVNILNKQSVSRTRAAEISADTARLKKFYLNENPDSFAVRKLKALRNRIRAGLASEKERVLVGDDQSWPNLVAFSEKWLESKNSERQPRFIHNRQ